MLSSGTMWNQSLANSKKILCVDDEPYILATLERFFRKDGFEVLLAGSGEKAIGLIEQHGPVDLVISDYSMPGMDGIEFLHQVKESWPKTVAILVSDPTDDVYPVRKTPTGSNKINWHISKPWNRTEFKILVMRALGLSS